MGCFAAMPQDGIAKRQRCSVVHHSRTQANSPQRGSAYFVPAALEILFRKIPGHHLKDFVPVVLSGGRQDSVACTDVVHQEIPVGMKGDGPQRGWDRERSSIDLGSGGALSVLQRI
jgi:hypothetical protein